MSHITPLTTPDFRSSTFRRYSENSSQQDSHDHASSATIMPVVPPQLISVEDLHLRAGADGQLLQVVTENLDTDNLCWMPSVTENSRPGRLTALLNHLEEIYPTSVKPVLAIIMPDSSQSNSPHSAVRGLRKSHSLELIPQTIETGPSRKVGFPGQVVGDSKMKRTGVLQRSDSMHMIASGRGNNQSGISRSRIAAKPSRRRRSKSANPGRFEVPGPNQKNIRDTPLGHSPGPRTYSDTMLPSNIEVGIAVYVHDYLTRVECPMKPAKWRSLVNPARISKADYFDIIKFLSLRIFPGLFPKTTSDVEDLTIIMKLAFTMRYPERLQKSHLKAPTTTCSWSHCLLFLTWLCYRSSLMMNPGENSVPLHSNWLEECLGSDG